MSDALILQAIPFIRMAANRLYPMLGSTDHTQDDLEQEIAVTLLHRIQHFDPSRGSLAHFVWMIGRHLVSQIRNHQQAKRRDCRRNVRSINQELPTGTDGIDFGVDISTDKYEISYGRRSRAEAQLLELRHDIDRALDRVPVDLMLAARAIMFDGVRGAGAALALSRSTIYRRVDLLREALTCAGLNRYVVGGAGDVQVGADGAGPTSACIRSQRATPRSTQA